MWVDDKELESSQQFKIALKSTLKFIRGFPTFRMRQTFNSNKTTLIGYPGYNIGKLSVLG